VFLFEQEMMCCSNQISENLRDAWNGNASMADACGKITEHMNKILAKKNWWKYKEEQAKKPASLCMVNIDCHFVHNMLYLPQVSSIQQK
jgi:hypothetical protein